MNWALVASAGAISEAHIDAGGYCTFIQVQFGRKIWYIAHDRGAGISTTPLPLDESANIDVKAFEWTRVVLDPGDIL